MIHARKDYERIQDPSKKIPEGMPVFLLLAKDRFAADTVEFYARKVLADPHSSSDAIIVGLRALLHANTMRRYGEIRGTKYPDVPENA